MEATYTVGLVRKLAEFKTVEPAEGQMLARKIEKGSGKDSLGVVIAKPGQEIFVAALENGTVLQAAYEWYLDQVQDACKLRMVEAGAEVLPEDYGISAIAAMLEVAAIREGRISKERIEQWFNSDVAPVLQAAFKAKLGESLTDEKMKHITNAYRDNFKLLAKRELVLADQAKENLGKVLGLMENSGIKDYCIAKLAEKPKIPDVGLVAIPD